MSRCDVDIDRTGSYRPLTGGRRCRGDGDVGWCSELNATDSSAAWRTDFRRCVMSAGSLRSKNYLCSLTFQPSALSAFRSQRLAPVACLFLFPRSLLSLVTSGQRLCSTARDAPSFSFRACLIVSSPPRSISSPKSRSVDIHLPSFKLEFHRQKT